MASSSAPVSVFDEHRFRKEFNQELFNSHARKRKVIPENGFNLNADEYPQIMEQVALRGWKRLAGPRTNVSELMMQEFYANAAVSKEEAAEQNELPYMSFVRGIKVDFSPSNIRRVMRFKSTTEGAEIDYNTRKAMDQRLDEVLRDLCIPGATWKLSSNGRTSSVSQRLARVHNPLTCSNEEQIGSHNNKGHSNSLNHARGRCKGGRNNCQQHSNNSSRVDKQGKPCPSNTVYKMCKDAGVPLREFRRTPRIPELSYITAKRMKTIRLPRHQPQQQHEDDDEDGPCLKRMEAMRKKKSSSSHNKRTSNNNMPRYESQYHGDLQGIEETLSSMQFFQQTFYENMQKSQADYMEEVKQLKEKQEQIYNHNQRFHSQIWQEQEKLAKEIQEVRRSQLTQTLAKNKRLETERNMQLALERQGRDIVEMRKQLNLWTRNTSAREAYTCWAH
ncbi:hypothetical protein PIB30_089956 [Stylosanthes scabra]|uniref:Putative plant transposon protein domain-containing protein n=1 Tax=Stylosanthes scabra TaxID=79078 RepID=A0ABU6YSY1_9FABA|nr:hypothetical protein [Stylosanthes scabra]